MSGDGLRTSVQAMLRQLFAEPDDLVLDLQRHRARVVMRPPRPGLKSGLALGLEAFDQFLHPKPGDAILAGDRTLRASLHGDGGDHESGARHDAPPRSTKVPTMSRDSCQLCRATSHLRVRASIFPSQRACLPQLGCRTGQSNPLTATLGDRGSSQATLRSVWRTSAILPLKISFFNNSLASAIGLSESLPERSADRGSGLRFPKAAPKAFV